LQCRIYVGARLLCPIGREGLKAVLSRQRQRSRQRGRGRGEAEPVKKTASRPPRAKAE